MRRFLVRSGAHLNKARALTSATSFSPKYDSIYCGARSLSSSRPTDQDEPSDKAAPLEVRVDASALGPESTARLFSPEGSMNPSYSDTPNTTGSKEALSPLAQELFDYINVRGPISLNEFLSQAANHVVWGYYQQKKQKIGGSKGDFVTAPEISQLFGEMIGVWCICVWEQLGKPKGIKLVELGPGNGTLMKDIIHTVRKHPAFTEALNVCLVELSDDLVQAQQHTLNVSKETLSENSKEGWIRGTLGLHKSQKGIPISWYKFLQLIPFGASSSEASAVGVEPVIFIGQEFLDAFPVHQFFKTKEGWKEKLIDVDTSNDSPFHFRTVQSKGVTPGIAVMKSQFKEKLETDDQTETSETKSGISIHSKQAFKEMKAKAQAQRIANAEGGKESDGQLDAIEFCPLAMSMCESIATIIKRCNGAALFVDYGENFTQGDTVRGFKSHKQVSVLSEPGLVDVTADVDFSQCAKAANRAFKNDSEGTAKNNVNVTHFTTQGQFLLQMGIRERVLALVQSDKVTEEQAGELISAFKRLVGSHKSQDNQPNANVSAEYMGERFKVLAISHPDIHATLPGFEAPNMS